MPAALHEAAAAAALDTLRALDAPLRDVAQAFALGWSPRSRRWLAELLDHLGWRDVDGTRWTPDRLTPAVDALVRAGVLVAPLRPPGHWQLPDPLRAAAYLALLDREPPQQLRAALQAAIEFDPTVPWPIFRTPEDAQAMVRLELHLGAPISALARYQHVYRHPVPEWNGVLARAIYEGFDAALFARLDRDLRIKAVTSRLGLLDEQWHPELHKFVDVARALIAECDTLAPAAAASEPAMLALRVTFAEHCALAGRPDEARAVIAPAPAAIRQLVDATLAATSGAFEAAAEGFEQALRPVAVRGAKKRKERLPASVAWLYPLSLIALQLPVRLTQATRFCVEQVGKRALPNDSALGPIAAAIAMRLGERPVDLELFRPANALGGGPMRNDFWNTLMRAWLAEPGHVGGFDERARDALAKLRARLLACDLHWLATQLDTAIAVVDGAEPPPGFFVPPARESWRSALSALAALGDVDAAAGAGSGHRIVWTIGLDAARRVTSVEPFEQRHGARGWTKPRPMALARLQTSEALEPWDARVARAIRPAPWGARGLRLDRAAAVAALVGHPAVEIADAPGRPVELVEGVPSLDVAERDGAIELHVHPTLPADDGAADAPGWAPSLDSPERREQEALRAMVLVRESARRVRLVRFSPAQRRAAQLIGEGLVVPPDGRAALEPALRVLAGHFDVQASDDGDPAHPGDADADHDGGAAPVHGQESMRTVPAEPGLRAELTPAGDGLALRIVVAPLGTPGPRYVPGAGRRRVIALRDGEPIAALRDLAGERALLQSVLDACPMLDTDDDARLDDCEWTLERPDDALGLLEALPAVPAIGGLDWPRGAAVRVTPLAAAAVKVQLRTGRSWFALRGGVDLDEGRVVTLTQLLEWSRAGRGRYVPLGEGRYLSITQELRSRLDELATVAETKADEARVPAVAAAWLQATLEPLAVDADAGFEKRLRRFDAALAETPALPASLHASLRPYQEEGYAWAMRLAQAGFGACLADDMGLGKTLQALAVLLARGAGGPALVVAPTSLCGNWSAEAMRFAPSLSVRIYGQDAELDRDRVLAEAGPMSVVVVSYTLLQQAQAAFTARDWHTLVVDEAQAIKNATALRSQAVLELNAGFRLALSGTPIENRLSELWSIMQLCNPGLLGSASKFAERFATPIERDRNRDAQRTLRRLIAPFVLRRTKAEVLAELPPRTEHTLVIAPGPEEAAHYEALRRIAMEEAQGAVELSGDRNGAGGRAQFHVLAQLTRLRRAACDPRLATPGYKARGAKVEAFAELVEELVANGHKALVFSQFVDFLTLLREPLDAAGVRYQYLDGATPAAERTRRVAAFQAGDGDLFLVSLKAGGFGLNLTAADDVIIADPWWNPAAEDQATGRAHRIGQKRPVTVYRLVTQGTLEESIVDLHRDKRALADSVLDGSNVAALPNVDELLSLMGGGQAAAE